jgi:hypothetical protein
MKEEDLVAVKYIANVDTGRVISTNEHFLFEEGYKRDPEIKVFIVWLRVKLIDNDHTFVGEVERVENNNGLKTEINILNIGDHVRLSIDRIDSLEDKNKSFCYSDSVTQCSCPGACRNK